MAECKPHVDVLIEPKETLPQGGYGDELFFEPPDETSSLRCPVCFLVLREPHLLSCCGSHLCQVSNQYKRLMLLLLYRCVLHLFKENNNHVLIVGKLNSQLC